MTQKHNAMDDMSWLRCASVMLTCVKTFTGISISHNVHTTAVLVQLI